MRWCATSCQYFFLAKLEKSWGKKRVALAYQREVGNLIRLEYANEVVYTTNEHPFFVKGTWVEASKLKVGDSLFVNAKTRILLRSITVIDTTVAVYNITVEDDHNYFVGRNRVLVHNNNPCAEEVKKALTKDQQALTDLVNEQLKIDEKNIGKKALSNKQADDALDLASDVNKNATQKQKVLDHRYSSGKNKPPGHFKHEGTNGHIHVGNANKGHVPVNKQ